MPSVGGAPRETSPEQTPSAAQLQKSSRIFGFSACVFRRPGEAQPDQDSCDNTTSPINLRLQETPRKVSLESRIPPLLHVAPQRELL